MTPHSKPLRFIKSSSMHKVKRDHICCHTNVRNFCTAKVVSFDQLGSIFYFSDKPLQLLVGSGHNITRLNSDGTGVEHIVEGKIGDLDYDVSRNRLFWIDMGEKKVIQRSTYVLLMRQSLFYFQRCWKILSCTWPETAHKQCRKLHQNSEFQK